MNQNKTTYGFIAFFLLILILPNIIMLSNIEDDETVMVLDEQSFRFNMDDLIGTARSFKSYYNENFGLKTTLVKHYIDFKRNILKEEPIPDRVIQGKNNFFFLGNHFGKPLNDSFGMETLSKNELITTAYNIIAIRDSLAKRQIPLYIVVVPNKHRVYQNNLPFQIENRPSRFQQLNKYLTSNFNYSLIGLEEQLFKQKEKEQIYHRYNTHWNDFGAYIGYRATMNRINHDFDIETVSRENYQVSKQEIRNDIANMVNLEINELAPVMEKENSSATIDTSSTKYMRLYRNDQGKKKMLMYHDSFGFYWIQFFAGSFNDSYFIKGQLIDYKLIDTIKPDMVVFEIVERNLITTFNNSENHLQ